MKTLLIKGVFCLLFLFLYNTGTAQKNIPDALKRKLAGKTKLPEIMKEVDEYYANEGKAEINTDNDEDEDEANAYVHWKRWEWWMSSHLDGNGNFVKNINKLNLQGLSESDRKWNAVIDAAVQNRSANNNTQRTVQQLEHTGSMANAPDDGGPDAPFGDWVFIGPTGDGTGPGDIKGTGRLDRIAFHPTNGSVFYVGAPSGNLWKTTNGGTSWASVTDGLPSPGVAGIAISPTNGNLLYVLTGDGDSYNPGYLVYDYGSSRASIGVYKSTDGGASWTATGNLFTGGEYEGHRLAISASNGNYLFATTSQGIYRTTDGGNNWTQVTTGEYWDVKFKPGSDSTIYATTATGIFYSTQGGRSGTWIAATTDFSVAAAGRIELAVSPNNSNYVYALGGGTPAAGSFTGIFRSVNSGVSYTRRSNTPNILGSEENGLDGSNQGAYDLGITAKPTDAEFVATCGLNVWVSSASNGGSAMTWSTKYREGYAGAANKFIHPDVHAVAYNPINNFLYACSDGGVYVSADDGLSWTNITNGICTSQLYGMAMRDADADGDGDDIGFLTGAQDNGMKHRPNSGATLFNHVICCDGYGTAIPAKDANILYMNINSNFYKSTDGGVSAVFKLGVTFFSPIVCDYLQSDTVYIGGSTTRRSYDGFTTTNLNTATNTRRVLTTCPSNQARLYGSAGTNLIRSDDRISTWATKSGTAGWPVGTFTINDIEAFPTNSLEVYTCFGGYSAGNKVMRSTTGGDSWTNWSGSLPNVPCYGLAVATEGVYVGTEIGVFFRSYTMTDWVPFSNQLPRTPVTELVVNNNGLIYASTFGRGTWLSNRRSACSNLLTISGVRTGQYYYEAGNKIDATITSPGTNGDEVFAQAGDTVIMKPGFEIKAGSFFKAYIAPCSNGGIPTTARAGEATVMVPRIDEIPATVQQPEQNGDYYKLTAGGKIEFNITGKGKLTMLAKRTNGIWEPFYPESIVYPGFYSVAQPNVFIPQMKVMFNGKELPRIAKK
jgi:photosystem II stability/assembly factor-like uncharacterized protein